jgi:arylsulfatase A-like enzyme
MVSLLWALAGCHTLPAGDPKRPDVVLISIDSLRADHLSSYGYKRDTTPALDALAKDGQRFTNAISGSPWTLPSHMTMMTGLWPTEHQVIEDDRKLADEVPVIAERMQAAGYATAGFVSAIYVSKDYGFARGFGVWNDFGLSEKLSLAHAVRTPELVQNALDWGKSLPENQPAFVFLHTYDAHYPYEPPKPWNTKYNPAIGKKKLAYRTWNYYKDHPLSKRRLRQLTAQYDESIRYIDDSLKPLIATWAWDRDVVFIVTADHGEELGERGSWGHAHTLYREALNVPLIVSGAGIEAGVRTDRVGNIDLAATIAAIAGVPWDIGDGRDLRSPVPDRPFWPETSRFSSNQLGLIDGPASAATALLVDLERQTSERYDLGADPKQKRPLTQAAPDMEQRIYAHLGEPWTLLAGQLQSTGALVQRGARITTTLVAPATFGIWPPDARLTLSDAPQSTAGVATTEAPTTEAPTTEAPTAEVLGTLGQADPRVRWSGPATAAPVTIRPEVKQSLEALGYTDAAP